jgi:hypothetical protein
LDLVRKQNFGARIRLLAGFDRSSIAKSSPQRCCVCDFTQSSRPNSPQNQVRSLKSLFTGKLLIFHLWKGQKGLYTKDYDQTQLFLHKKCHP